MLKRIFALILTLILTVVSIPIQAIAAEIGEWIPSPELPTSSGEVGLIDPVQVEVVDDLIVDHDNSDPALDYADLTPDTTGITGACTWALYGTELVISGNGKMADYNDTDNLAPWGNEITKVTIGSGVTNIGNSAFSSCKSLTSVTIPETVKNIGSFAFENASALTSVSLPEGVEEIGLQAFRNCTKLSSVSLPDSLALVGEEAFLGCNLTYKYYYDGNFHGKYLGNPSNPYVLMYSVAPNNNNYSYKLTSFTVHPNTRVIGPTAFFNKTDLKTVTLSESLQGISDYAFYGCTALTNLSLPESVSHIGAGAFYNCVGITDANTDSLKYIGMGAFGGCLGITSVDFSDKLEYIGAQAFYGCSNLGSITLSDNVSYIGEAAFYGCKSSIYYTYSNATYISSENNKYHTLVKVNSQALTSFSIPSGTKVILENAFNGCNKLTSLTLPSSLKYIGYGAFNGCSGLTSLDIPVSVTYIGNAAFSGCSSLQTLSLPYVDILHQLFGKTSGEGLYTAAYNTTAYYIPTSLKTISVKGGNIKAQAFENCTSLTSISLSNTLEIGAYAFRNCSSIKTMTIPKSVQVMGEGIFSGCSSLEELTIPFVGISRMTTDASNLYPLGYLFGEDSYSGSYQADQVIENKSLTTKSYYIPSSLKRVTVTDSDAILYGAFSDCDSLLFVALEEGITEIADYAFYSCGSLERIAFPNCLESIGSYAFKDDAMLDGFSIPESVNSIGAFAFNYCSRLTEIVIPEGVEFIGDSAFSECGSLQSIFIPDSIKYIGNNVFGGCFQLQKNTDGIGYYLGNEAHPYVVLVGVTSRDITSFDFYPQTKVMLDDSFFRCENLESIVIPEGFTKIPEYAFAYCYNLSFVEIPDSVMDISGHAFLDCYSLKEIQLPENLKKIGQSAFSGCTGITSAIIPAGVEEIASDVYSGCTGLINVVIPDSVEQIGWGGMFDGCGSIESITIPFIGYERKISTELYQYPFGSIFSFGTYAGATKTEQFYYYESLSYLYYRNFYISSSLKTVTVTGGDLNYGAFSNCKIEKIIIGEGVNNILPEAFIGTTALKSIEVSENNPNYCSVNGILYNKDKSEIIWVPDNLTFDLTVNYLYATGETAGSSVTKTVKYNTAYSVEVPEILGYTPNYTEISGTMPAYDLTIDVIYYEHELIARGDCNSGISWTLYTDGTLVLRGSGEMPDYTSGTAPWAAYADKVQSVYIDSSITYIGAYSFENCVNLTFIDYGYGVKSIGKYAFKNCSALVTFKLPSTVTSISEGAFSGCIGLKDVVIPDNITAIGADAFNGCDELIKVTIGGAVTEIGSDAFANCAKLTQIYFRGKPATLGNNAFGGVSGKFVYYYSTISGWDNSVSDGKYYGYTAIPYNAISKENFDGTNVYIIKVVDKYNTPLVGAVVELNGKVQAANDDGMAYFIKPDSAVGLTVSCSNHITFIDNEFSATTTQIMDIIELSDKPSVVQGVRADGKSIATSVVTVNSASGKNVSIAVSGYSKYTIIKYELYQGTRLISTIKTNATDATFNVAASAFEEGETVVVRMHSSDGNMVATALNIDVVKLAKINENQVLTELSDISMDVNMGGLGSFKFELPFTSSDAPNLKVYTEGRSIYVGINMDPKDIVTKKLSKSDIVKAIDKTIKSDAFDDVDASLDFCGYLEIEYLGEGEYYIKSSYVKMSVAVNFETQIQASFYGIVGVYFKVGIGASGELELKIARFEPDSGFAFEQADITLETIMDLEGGVYLLWGAGSAGFYGTITIGFTIGVVPVTQWKQVYAEGDFGLRWSVLWGMIKGQYSVVSGDFFRWTNDGAKSMMAQIRRAMSDPSNYTQNDRSYLENRSEWLSGIEENTLQTSIYGEVAPKIVTCGDTTMMVWLDDNSERDFDNFQTLYYSVYNDGIWSSPVAVDNNETFDCEFDVYSDGNAIYVIYTEMLSRYVDMQSIDISDPAAIQALIGNVEVMATVYENGKFSDPVRLTNNAICEQMPVIGEVDGYITAAWLESNSMGIDDAEYENNLVTSVLDVIGWTKPETIVSGNKTISEIVCFSLDGNEYLAYVVDGDGNSDTVDDKMLVLREENGDSVQLDSGAIASVALSCVAGGEVLTWYNGNQLYMMTSTDDAPISLLPESVIGSRNYQIVPIDFEKSLLLFTDNTETEGSDIFGMYIGADGAISSPVRMTESEGYIASYAVYTVNGDYFVVYNETHATVTENDVNTVSNLKIAELDFGCDIKIDHVEYDLTEAYPENDFELHFALTNEGSAPVDGVRMNFFDPFGALIYTADVDAVLASGESGEIEFSILLPKSIAAEAYTAEILPISKMAVVPDSDPEGNRVEIMLAFSDMSISAEQKIIGEKNYVLFSVTNEGNTASTAMLYVYAEGRLIADLKTDSISPATSSQYLIDINALTTAEDKILTCSVKSDFNDNCELNDNDSLCLLHIEDSTLAVDPDDALRNPELSEYTFEFDKYTPENIELLIISEADYFKSITGLTKDVDYTVDYDALTINSSVFAGLDEGIHSFDLVFDFNGASVSRTVTVSVSDTTPITINGSISIIGEIVVGGVVYADISGLTPTRPEVDYVWTINGVTVGNDREYLIKPEDYGKKLVLTVSAREGYVGSFNYEADVTMRKAETPSLPVISRVDCDEIALVRIDGVEYSLDGVSWQTENVFTALLPNTTYTVYARKRATETAFASDPTVGVAVTTLKKTVNAPSAPELKSKSHDSITLAYVEGMEYKIEGGEWTDSNLFTGLAPVTEYRFYQRYKETETSYASEATYALFTTDPISVSGVVLDEALSVNTYEKKTLNWSILPSNATNQSVTFASSDPEIATVNEQGEVTGVKEGYAYITITTADGGFTDNCVVTVICSHANLSTVPERESDCMNAGWDAYSVCDDCERLFDSQENELDEIPYRELNDVHVGGTELLNYSEPVHSTQTDGYTGDVKCLGCGDIIEYGHPITVEPHEEKDEWSTDGENHWKECSICDAIIDDTLEAHDECDEWSTDGENHWKECSICDAVIDDTREAHDECDEWSTDGENHWKECSVCDAIIDDTRKSHSEGEWLELDDGSYELRCDKCGELLETKPASVMLGDVNNDGVVNQYDYILIKRHYFATRILSEDETVRADVNRDNKVDQYDYILVARHYFGTYEIK